MDGPSGTPEIRIQPQSKDRPLITRVTLVDAATRLLEINGGIEGAEERAHRYVYDRRRKALYIVEKARDDTDVNRDRIQHADIVNKLIEEKRMAERSDALGGYLTVDTHARDGQSPLMHTGSSTSILAVEDWDAFDKYLGELDFNNPDSGIFLLDETYGLPQGTNP